MTDAFDTRAREIAWKHIQERGGFEVGDDLTPIIAAISSALREAVEAERAAWLPLYGLAVEYQIYHEGIMFAWIDKASPDAKEALERLRNELFAACRHVREKTGLSADEIASAIRGESK